MLSLATKDTKESHSRTFLLLTGAGIISTGLSWGTKSWGDSYHLQLGDIRGEKKRESSAFLCRWFAGITCGGDYIHDRLAAIYRSQSARDNQPAIRADAGALGARKVSGAGVVEL